jgi:MATE family multidrug resistance protein
VVFEVGAFSLSTLMAGRLSPDILAAHQIVLNSASLTYMVPLGVSAAAAISVGHAVGAGNRARARRNGSMAIAIGAVFMALAATAFLTIPQRIIHVYTHDAQTVAVAVRLLAVAAVFQVFDGIQGIGTGAMRGLGKTRGPMLINLVAYGVIGLPIGYVLCFKTSLGIYGLWSGLTLALIFAAALVLTMWLKDSRVV